jgi:glycosyltransferase involved in cell wall biosynthesis
MNILFLSSWFPYPPDNGSKLRIFNILRGLSRQHEITLLSFADRDEAACGLSKLWELCREIRIVPRNWFNPRSHRAIMGYLSKTPRAVLDTYSSEMANHIVSRLSQKEYDLIIASEVAMAVYAPYFHHIPTIFEDIEVGAIYEQYAYAKTPWLRFRRGLTWMKHRHYLIRMLDLCRTSTVVSEKERELLSKVASNHHNIEVIPNCINLSEYSFFGVDPQPNSLIFTGSFSYFPNYEAMKWFLGEVFPDIRFQVPEVNLKITGDHENRILPPIEDVTYTGFVEDVQQLIASSWISLAPIWSGSGTRLKILESMALGTPVVATSKGAEGLEVDHGVHLLIADTPDSFAEMVVCLLKNSELRRQLADNAYQLMREMYDWAVVMPRFLELVERVASATGRR